MEKNKKSLPTKNEPEMPKAFTNKANGSMDYLSKQDKMASEDAKKINRGAYKDKRYE